MLRRADDTDDNDDDDDDDDEKEKDGDDKLLECLANLLTCFMFAQLGRLPPHNFNQFFLSEIQLRTLDFLSDASFMRASILENSQGKR